MPGKHLRLNKWNQAKRRLFIKKGVQPLILLPFLPSGENGAPRFIAHHHGPAVARFKIRSAQLAAVDQRQRQPVGKRWPEFLHQIKRQAWPPGPVPVQKADCRVEAHTFRGAAAVMGEQGVKKRQQRIDWVQRRAAGTASPAQFRVGRTDQIVKHREIEVGGLAL